MAVAQKQEFRESDYNSALAEIQALKNEMAEMKAKAEAAKNKNFIQMYRGKALIAFRSLKPTSKDVLMLLIEKMNIQNCIIVSQQLVADILGRRRETINIAFKELQKKKFITKLTAGGADCWAVNSDVAWTTHAKLKNKVAVFTATVMTSLNEQKPDYEENWEGIDITPVRAIVGGIEVDMTVDELASAALKESEKQRLASDVSKDTAFNAETGEIPNYELASQQDGV